MRLAFSCVVLAGVLYFLGRKRRVDFFSLGFFGGCFYFLPGLFGFVFTFDRFDLGGLTQEIYSETYMIMALVLVSIVLSAFLFDRRYGEGPWPQVSIPVWGSPDKWATLFAVVGFVGSLLTTGHRLLDADKVDMLLYLDRWSILWEVGATVGLVLAFAKRKPWTFGICGLLLLADWGIGFRANIILAALSIAVYAYSRKGALRFGRETRALAFVAALALFGFFINGVIGMAKAGDVGQLKEVLTSPDYYVGGLLVSEPFGIQTTLNEVIGEKFRVGPAHLSSVVYELLPFGNNLGKMVSFNDLFQEHLFPGLAFGMANNIWAQAWSVGGLPVVVIFIFLYIAGLWQGSKFFNSQRASLRVFAALFFTPWAFYIYRNDVAYQFIMERRILMMCAFVLFIAALLGQPSRRSDLLDPLAKPPQPINS